MPCGLFGEEGANSCQIEYTPLALASSLDNKNICMSLSIPDRRRLDIICLYLIAIFSELSIDCNAGELIANGGSSIDCNWDLMLSYDNIHIEMYHFIWVDVSKTISAISSCTRKDKNLLHAYDIFVSSDPYLSLSLSLILLQYLLINTLPKFIQRQQPPQSWLAPSLPRLGMTLLVCSMQQHPFGCHHLGHSSSLLPPLDLLFGGIANNTSSMWVSYCDVWKGVSW